jgi:hypothetical protein
MVAEHSLFTSEPMDWDTDYVPSSSWDAFDPTRREEPPSYEFDLGAFGTTQGMVAGPSPKTDSDGTTIGGEGGEGTEGSPSGGDEAEDKVEKEEKGKLAEAAEDFLEFIKGLVGSGGGGGTGGGYPGWPGGGSGGPGVVDDEPLPPEKPKAKPGGGDDTPGPGEAGVIPGPLFFPGRNCIAEQLGPSSEAECKAYCMAEAIVIALTTGLPFEARCPTRCTWRLVAPDMPCEAYVECGDCADNPRLEKNEVGPNFNIDHIHWHWRLG